MIKKSVSKTQILSRISEFLIFKRYAPKFKVDKLFYGDIGRDGREKAPSANISFLKGRWRYHDYGLNLTLSAIDYVMAKFSLTYQDALEKIDIDFGLGFTYSTTGTSFKYSKYSVGNFVPPEERSKSRSILKIKSQKFTNDDLNYWYNNAWTLDMLNAAKIRSISSFYFKDSEGDFIRFNTKNELAFSYDYYNDNDGIFQRKIYRPNRKYGKWYSNVNNKTVQGWDLLPKIGNILFITSSLKDTGVFWRIYGIPVAIAPNNEGSFIPDEVFYKLNKRYNQIIIFFDNDIVGIENAKKYSSKYNIKYIHNPILAPKDPVDMIRSYENVDVGIREFNYYLQQNLKSVI